MRKSISLLLVLALLVSIVSVSTIYAAGNSLVASLFVERDLLEVTFTENVTDAAVVLFNNSVNPPVLVEGLSATYDAATYTLKVSFGDHRIPLNALHQLMINYNGSASETRYFILKKLIEDHFDYASTTALQTNWTGGALGYYDANANGVQDADESNLWKPGNVWQGAFPKALAAPTWKNYTLEFTHIMNMNYGDWGAGFLVPGATGKIDKGNLVQGALLFQGPPGGSGGLYAYKTSTGTRPVITGTNMSAPTDAKGTTYKYKASIINGVFRGKITGSNGFVKEVKYTVDTNVYSLNNAGNIGIMEGGQGGMNDDVYLYSFQEVIPPTSIGIASWTADKESASITFNTNISGFSENIELIDIVDSNGNVVPTVKTVDLNKITFVPQSGVPFGLDTIYKFVVSPGFSDMTGAYSLMEPLEQKFTLLTLFADNFESYASGAVGVNDNWTGENISWENGKMKSNNTWKGVYANEVAQKAGTWSDYILEYTAERGGSQFLFGSGVRVQDYTNNNGNNGVDCKPGGYLYMSSYDLQAGMLLKNNSNGTMSKISAAPTLSNAVGDAVKVKTVLKGNTMSTSVTGIGQTAFSYNNTVDVNTTTYNYPATGGFTFNTANNSAVYFDNVLAYKAVVPGNEPYAIENVKAEIVDGTCVVSYQPTGDIPDPAPSVMAAVYQGTTLIGFQKMAADDTAAIFTNVEGATSARVLAWEDLQDIRPILNISPVRVVPAPARKRVKVQNGTVVTHEGELLRGVFTSVTGANYSKIAATKELGCNSLHIYPEAESDHLTVGTRVAQVDKFVEITKALGMYLIITVGDSKFDEPFNTAFWNFYAPRYKDETHVIYEIQNEATAFGNTPAATRDKEVRAYNLLRGIAPDTHIMFFSYSRFMSWDNVRTDLEYLNANNVDWTNASVAWHGYGSDIEDIKDIYLRMKAMGVPSMSTELPASMNNHAYPELLQMCEELGVSWNHFVLLDYVVSQPSYWKTEIEMGGVKWKSDFGSWPDMASTTPFQGIDLSTYKASQNVQGSQTSGYQFSDGGYVAYNQATFGTGPALLDMVCATDNEGGYFEVRLDNLTGPLVGTLNVANTNGLDVTQTCAITDATGTRDLYFIYHGDGVKISSAIFAHTPRNPYVQINAADYDYQHGVDLGLADGGSCIGALHKNDYVRFDNVDFGAGGITKFYARGSSPYTTYNIEVRIDSLDGPVLGTCPMPITGSWNTYQTEECAMGSTTGRHTLYLIFVDGNDGGGLGNLRWVYFK